MQSCMSNHHGFKNGILRSPKQAATISIDMGLAKSTISRYISGVRTPDLSTAIKLARYFNVSLDWLCGIAEEKRLTDEKLSTLIEVYPLLTDDDKDIIDILVRKHTKGEPDDKSD